MAAVAGEQARFAFDLKSDNVVYASSDGLLRVWESETRKLKHEYLPSSHLSASCSCLGWLANRRGTTPKAKKIRKNGVSTANSEEELTAGEIIAIGTTAGVINIYSATKGEVICQLEGQHSTPVTDLCIGADSQSLFSCSEDGCIVHWNTKKAKCKKQWRGSKMGLSSLAMCGSGYLVAAGHTITVWDLKSYTKFKTFTGHATNITQLHCISSTPGDIDSAYIVSIAQNDRVVNVWKETDAPKSKKSALVSFILDNEPHRFSVHRSQGIVTMAVLTTASTVEVFKHRLNGSVNKPIKSISTVQFKSSHDEALPVLAVSAKENSQLLLMYGSAVSPAFETVTVEDTDLCLIREDITKSISVTRHESVINIREPKIEPNKVTTVLPTMASGRRLGMAKTPEKLSKKRTLEEREPSMEERLSLLRGSKVKSTPVNSVATLLIQGLQSEDKELLNNTFCIGDPVRITATIKSLPVTCVEPLLRELTSRLEQYGTNKQNSVTQHYTIIKWVRALLHKHASYLASVPWAVSKLQKIYSLLENRVGHMITFARLQGRLQLMLQQISDQKSLDDDEETAASAALLSLQDESSEDELLYDDVDMLGATSESEDEDDTSFHISEYQHNGGTKRKQH